MKVMTASRLLNRMFVAGTGVESPMFKFLSAFFSFLFL